MLSPSVTLPRSVAARFADDFQCRVSVPLLPEYIDQLDVFDDLCTSEIVYHLALVDGYTQIYRHSALALLPPEPQVPFVLFLESRARKQRNWSSPRLIPFSADINHHEKTAYTKQLKAALKAAKKALDESGKLLESRNVLSRD